MKLPRNVNGPALQRIASTSGLRGHAPAGLHMRITTQLDGEHHGSAPMRHPIGVETLSSIPKSMPGAMP